MTSNSELAPNNYTVTHTTTFTDRLILDSEKKRRETTRLYGEQQMEIDLIN